MVSYHMMTLFEFTECIKNYNHNDTPLPLSTVRDESWFTNDVFLLLIGKIRLREQDYVEVSRYLLSKITVQAFSLWLSEYPEYHKVLIDNINQDKTYFRQHEHILKKIEFFQEHMVFFNVAEGLPLHFSAAELNQYIYRLTSDDKKTIVDWYIAHPESFENLSSHTLFELSGRELKSTFIFDLIKIMAFYHLDKALLFVNKPIFKDAQYDACMRSLQWLLKPIQQWNYYNYASIMEDNSAIFNRTKNPLVMFISFLEHNKNTLLSLETMLNFQYNNIAAPKMLKRLYQFFLHPELLTSENIILNEQDYYDAAIVTRKPQSFRWTKNINDFLLAYFGVTKNDIQNVTALYESLGIDIRQCDLKTLAEYIHHLPSKGYIPHEEMDLML